jgi:hypothetical protein
MNLVRNISFKAPHIVASMAVINETAMIQLSLSWLIPKYLADKDTPIRPIRSFALRAMNISAALFLT